MHARMKLVIVLFSTLMGSTYMAELSTAQSVACVCVLGRELGVDRLVTVRSSKAIYVRSTIPNPPTGMDRVDPSLHRV